MELHSPSSLRGFIFIALATAIAIVFVEPLVEQVSQKLFNRSAENLLSFGKAS